MDDGMSRERGMKEGRGNAGEHEGQVGQQPYRLGLSIGNDTPDSKNVRTQQS